MYPRLFQIGPFTIYSFGLMMGIGFIIASYFLTSELRRKGLEPDPRKMKAGGATLDPARLLRDGMVANLGSTITFLAVIFGIIGSKLFYLFENWSDFLREPMSALSPGGLTWYGGFFLATFAIYLYTRKKKIFFLRVCDAAAPALMLGYGIARVGCHLSGDGDYGMPTTLPWGSEYSLGTHPPSLAFKEFPEIVRQYGINGVIPNTIAVHPTPLYELLLAVAVFLFLWKLRVRTAPDGKIFAIYLILSGCSRFFVEFIRINPRILFGLSEAQIISLIIISIGAAGMWSLSTRQRRTTQSTP